MLTENFELQLWPENVLGIRWNKELRANEWLIKWQGLPESDATWESVYQMNQQFPSFHLEDKVNVEPRGIVRPPILHTYKRRDRKVIQMDKNEEKGKKRGIVRVGPRERECGKKLIYSTFWDWVGRFYFDKKLGRAAAAAKVTLQ